MSESESMTADEFFGVEQTDQARLEVKVSYSALHQGRPYYPEARYGDNPRIAEVEGEDGSTRIVVESEADLRARVISTALNALQEWNAEFIASQEPKPAAATTKKKETK